MWLKNLVQLQTAYNVVSYKGNPRLQTAVQLLKTTEEIEQQLEKVTHPTPTPWFWVYWSKHCNMDTNHILVDTKHSSS